MLASVLGTLIADGEGILLEFRGLCRPLRCIVNREFERSLRKKDGYTICGGVGSAYL